jgi:hypothetical protein
MAARIEDQLMTAGHGGCAIATARYSTDAAADGQGAWMVSGLPRRLFTRDQAITSMVLAERLAAGYGDDDRFVIGWCQELVVIALPRLGAEYIADFVVARLAELSFWLGRAYGRQP